MTLKKAVKAEKKTYTLYEAAALLGVGKGAAYDAVKRTGEMGGVRVLRSRRAAVGVPRAPLDRVLNGEQAT